MRYVLYFQPRSGSTLVCSRLNSGTGQAVNGFEIIDADAALRADLLTPGEFDNFDPVAKKVVVDRFFELHADSNFVGFKVAPYQIDDDLAGFVQHISHQVQRQIFLTRDNPVQSALSQLWSNERAKQGLPARIVKGEEDTVGRSHVDQAEFEYYVINSMLERESVLALSRLTENPLVFSYETLCASQSSVFDAIKQYLGIPAHTELARSNLVKVRTDGAASHVANLDDVERWVRQMGLDTTLLHDELAQIGGASCRLVAPSDSPEKGSVQLPRRREARSFLATRITHLRSIAIEMAKRHARQSDATDAIINDFKARAARAESFCTQLQQRIESLQLMHSTAQSNWEASASKSLLHAQQLEARATRAETHSQEETARLRALLESAREQNAQRFDAVSTALAAMQDRAERAEQYSAALQGELESARHAQRSNSLAWEFSSQQASIHAAELEARAVRAEAYSAELLSVIDRQRSEAAAMEQEYASRTAALKSRADRAESYGADLRRLVDEAQATIKERNARLGESEAKQDSQTRHDQ